MQDFSTSPREIVASFWRNRSLIYALSKREVVGRYRGSYFGILWSFITPLFMLIVYTFVFSVIFKARWSGFGDSKLEFASVLFLGLIAFNFFSECVIKAPSLILSNVNYVKKVMFPLEILPMVAIGSALFHLCISLIVWGVFQLCFFGPPPVTSILLPLLLLPLMLLTFGTTLFLASIGVYLRDISQVAGVFVAALMFLTPIFYPITALPEEHRYLLGFNPIGLDIDYLRDALIWGKCPDWISFLSNLIISSLTSYAGYFWFQKSRKGFSDVL